jgi:hypothetical protein
MTVDPKLQAAVDQSIKAMVDMFPPLWRGIHQGLIAEGFTKEEAMQLLIAFIMKGPIA